MSNAPRELVFMVRMWAQSGEGDALGEWRGSIADVASGMRVYVTGARDVADFITARMTVARTPAGQTRGTDNLEE